MNESLEFTIKKFKTIFFSLILLEVICANIHWRAAAIIKTEKEMLHLDVLNKHFSRTTGSLGLSTVEKDLDQPCVVLMLCVVYIHVYKRPVD